MDVIPIVVAKDLTALASSKSSGSFGLRLALYYDQRQPRRVRHSQICNGRNRRRL